MKNFYLITYKIKEGKWKLVSKTIQANSPEDAIKKMDMWPPLIIKVEKI
jgi:hypothetical protein